ncbi:hypothetical protein IW142_001109 [Coemansia sp. RSA 564]|nr:hypothetical protein IW142_001109 [Coemansia sp. RSA 564]
MSVSDKMYFSDVLYIAISEIAYYRYLLPESFFDDALFEDVEVHRIMKGKSVESDTLLEVLEMEVLFNIACSSKMRTCYRCKRQFHVQCYEMEGDLVPLLAICLTCQAHDVSGTVATFSLCRLALARRAAGLAYKQKTERVTWLMKHMGCKIDKGRSIIEAIRAFGLLQIDKNARPKMFTVAYSSWPSAQAVLFGTDIEAAIAATAIQKGKR